MCLPECVNSTLIDSDLLQVIDLHEVSPEEALGFCQLLPHHQCRLLVCGGDGTVGWVLSSLDKTSLKVSLQRVSQPFEHTSNLIFNYNDF